MPLRFEQMNNVQGWRLPNVGYVSFVRYPEHEDSGALDWSSGLIQYVLDTFRPIARHIPVNLAGKIDEPGDGVEASQLP